MGVKIPMRGLTGYVDKITMAFLLSILLAISGCGDDSPTDGKVDREPIKTGISGTTYLNVEHSFRLSNLPSPGWVIKTRKYRESDTETVLVMAYTTEDKFTVEENELVAQGIPHATVDVIGPIADLPSKPDAAKEVMNIWIDVWEYLGLEIVSRKPVAGVNTTGYEAIIRGVSTTLEGAVPVKMKYAFFAKHEKGYVIRFWAPEDMFDGLIAEVDAVIANFELVGL